jgi:hypothetical protein
MNDMIAIRRFEAADTAAIVAVVRGLPPQQSMRRQFA